MKILSAMDSIFRLAAEAEHQPWSPAPIQGPYDDDHDWQKAHLWDHYTETENPHGPFRGPTILHHPDLQHALDNGWRVVGGDKMIDHQSRGETGSGSAYLYKIGKDGLIHEAGLEMAPEDTHLYGDDDNDQFEDMYGSVPEKNWHHRILSEGGAAGSPEKHRTLRDLVDDETARSMDPTGKGYSDFKPYVVSGGTQTHRDWERKHQQTIRNAWTTGTNEPHKHWDDPIPDVYDIDKIPFGGSKRDTPPSAGRSRYGAADDEA